MGIDLVRYDDPCSSHRQSDWNRFVRESHEGTLFHRLDFLAYHGERFRDSAHNLAWYKGEHLFGVMPMALFGGAGAGRIAGSPYGASFGGPVFREPLSYSRSRQALSVLMTHLNALDVAECAVTLPPSCYAGRYSETVRLVLLEHGFQLTNRDITSVVDLQDNEPVTARMSSRARNMARKAYAAGVETVHRGAPDDFWPVLRRTMEQHVKHPTHTQDEFQWLCDRFPHRVYVDVAYLRGVPIAGIGFLELNRRVNSSFYLCQDPAFRKTQALSLLIVNALARARRKGFEWFDFGTSSANMQGRANLFRFKESFGAVGLFRDTYVWKAT